MSNKKLIKLITNDSNANFDNQFRNEIVINKNSEIALHSLSMTREETQISISPENDTITFDIAGSLRTIRIQNGSYSIHHIPSLINNINKKINSVIQQNLTPAGGIANIEFGSYMQGVITNNRPTNEPKFSVKLLRPPFLNAENTDTTTENVTANAGTLFKTTDTGDANLNTSFFHYDMPFIRGCGSFRARLNLIADNINPADPNGFIIGLTSKIEDLGVDFAEEDIKFGIKLESTTSNYKKIINGVETDIGTAPLKFNNATAADTHDYLDISQNGGRIIGKVYQDGNTIDMFNEPNVYTDNSFVDMDNPNNESLYGVIIFFSGQSRVILDSVRFHGAEDENTNAFDIDEAAAAPVIAAGVTILREQQSSSNGSFTFNFANKEISKYFGYAGLLSLTSNTDECGFESGRETFIQSTEPFIVLDSSDIYIIELMNIPLDSYEAYTEQRKNVLAVIPVNENNVNMSVGTLQYESPNLNYISIKNEYDFSLRNIKARVVNSRFEPIITDGTSHITLFIRDKGE